MKILAMDSSQTTVSAAVAEDGRVLGEYTVNGTKDHSQTLLPVCRELMERLGLEFAGLDAVAVSGGPGSFTGLRIGSAAAKGLGLALDIPLIHVPTPDLMAFGIFGAPGLICPLIDARNSRVFTGLYRFRDDFEVVEGAFSAEAGELAEKLNGLGEEVIFTGAGAAAVKELLDERLSVPHLYAPAHLDHPRAAACAVLATRYFLEGRTVSASDEVPEYMRVSQAEREFEKRTGMSVEEAVKKEHAD